MELDNDVYVDAAETQLQQEDNEARHSRLEPPVAVASTDPDKDLDENMEAKDVGSLRYGEMIPSLWAGNANSTRITVTMIS
jgi:hypothetical protein